MNIVRFSPFERMKLLRCQIDRVFADLESNSEDSYSAWISAIELLDNSDNLILRMQLAGIDREDIDIQVTRESVIISGKRSPIQEKSTRCLHSEFNYGKFQRQISLPVPVINSQATAKYEAGILVLLLPKAEETSQRKVKVSLENTNSASTRSEKSTEAEAAIATV